MKLIKKYGLVIFWVILILDCALCVINNREYRIYTKLLLVPTLALYFYINTKRGKYTTFKTYIYSTLFIAWVGDILLLQYEGKGKDFYLLTGIISHLTAFSIYGIMFKRMFTLKLKDCQEAFLGFFASTLVCVVFYKFLSATTLEIFKYPIIIGMVAMVLVMTYATNLIKDKVRNNMAVKFFIPGIIILKISLGILLASRFLLKEADFLPAVIMLTYGYGQMLVMRGFTKYLKA